MSKIETELLLAVADVVVIGHPNIKELIAKIREPAPEPEPEHKPHHGKVK